MVKFWFLSASIFGFLSVALGAFGAHSLKNILDDYGKSIYEKAVLYQMFHTAALFAVGAIQHLDKETSFSIAGWGFFIGIILFALRERLSPEMAAAGYVLAYVACVLLLVHLAFYSYYSRKH